MSKSRAEPPSNPANPISDNGHQKKKKKKID